MRNEPSTNSSGYSFRIIYWRDRVGALAARFWPWFVGLCLFASFAILDESAVRVYLLILPILVYHVFPLVFFLYVPNFLLAEWLHGMASSESASSVEERIDASFRNLGALVLTGLTGGLAQYLVMRPGVATERWLPLGSAGWPLVWAAVFAPWFLIVHWEPAPARGRVSPVRLVLLLLSASALAGWLYLFSPWLA